MSLSYRNLLSLSLRTSLPPSTGFSKNPALHSLLYSCCQISSLLHPHGMGIRDDTHSNVSIFIASLVQMSLPLASDLNIYVAPALYTSFPFFLHLFLQLYFHSSAPPSICSTVVPPTRPSILPSFRASIYKSLSTFLSPPHHLFESLYLRTLVPLSISFSQCFFFRPAVSPSHRTSVPPCHNPSLPPSPSLLLNQFFCHFYTFVALSCSASISRYLSPCVPSFLHLSFK